MKEIKAYKCEHCKKLYQLEHACKKHEDELCRKNPKLKAKCFCNCKHLQVREATYYLEGYEDPIETTVNIYYCSKKNSHIIPFWATKKGRWYEEVYIDNEDLDNIHAPMECEDYFDR